MNKKSIIRIKWLIGIGVATVTTVAYCIKPYTTKDVNIAQSDLISASGILAGIVIAFLSTKLLQLADYRSKAQVMLNEYADRLTQFRKLLFRVIKSDVFWVFKNDIAAFRKEAPDADWHTLHGDSDNSKELRQKFWLGEENPYHQTTVDLHLAMEEIVLNTTDSYWIHGSQDYTYDLKYLQRATMPANQIWYFLEGRYTKHTIGQIAEITDSYELSELNNLVRSVAPQYKNNDFSRELLGDMGAYFESEVFPEMLRLTHGMSERFTRSILNMFRSLLIVLLAGVIFPLLFEILNLGVVEKLLTAACVTTVVISLLIFLTDLLGFASDDMSITDRERVTVKPVEN